MRRILLFFLVLLPMVLPAQRERNYIYLLDCTKSMIGHGGAPNIWESTKNYLNNELGKHSPGTFIHVIPFQGKALPAINFYAENYKWNEIQKMLDKHVLNITNTNICDAWDAIDGYIDSHKDNYVILLTDGKDNVNGMEVVAKKLTNWCGKYPNTYAFYVQLTEAAIDEKVAKVINICDNEFIVDGTNGIPVFGGFDKGLIIYANTLNLKKVHLIGFSAVGKYSAKAICKDPYFDVTVLDNKIQNGIVSIQINAKLPIAQINTAIPQTYDFTFDVMSDEVSIINPTIKVQMTNKPERSLEALSEETSLGKATWYDSFLFWSASDPDTLSVDLRTLFNEEAVTDGASVNLQIADPDGGKDFQVIFNDRSVINGDVTINARDKKPSILSIVFNPEAKEGNRYFSIKATQKHELDKINDQPVELYQLTLRSKYVVKWNPLKSLLMWLGILILAVLLLWFLLVKHFLYPTIKIKTIQINDPYFAKINVKGKRRVVFTNKKMEQSMLSRIFTGEILYKKHDIWTSPLIFEAGAQKKTLRVTRTQDYVFDPYTSMLKAPSDYVVENTNDNIKIKISIN